VCVWSCDEYSGHLTLRLFVSNLHCVWNRCCCSAYAKVSVSFVCNLCTFMVFAKVCISIMGTIIIAHKHIKNFICLEKLLANETY